VVSNHRNVLPVQAVLPLFDLAGFALSSILAAVLCIDGDPSSGVISSEWIRFCLIASGFWCIAVTWVGGYSSRLWNSGVELYVSVLKSIAAETSAPGQLSLII